MSNRDRSGGPKRRLGRTEFLTCNDYDASLGWIRHLFNESEMALFSECTP